LNTEIVIAAGHIMLVVCNYWSKCSACTPIDPRR